MTQDISTNQVKLTCKRCGRKQTKWLKPDQMIGPHKNMKKGLGLPQREPDDIVIRRKGYGTMGAVACQTCGYLRHRIRHKY